MNYFTKYTWLNLLKFKYEVPTVFTQFKKLVEKLFQTTIIITLYTNEGTKYIRVHTTTLKFGIQHIIFFSYTLKIAGTVEHRHCHIVDISFTPLHQASISLFF